MDDYNSTYEKAYTRSACLDVERRNTKEPELLLESPEDTPIVLEHKTVVWPLDYFSNHRNQHDLHGRIVSLLKDDFNKAAYLLSVNEASLNGRRKRDIYELADQIANAISTHQDSAMSSLGVHGQKPIPWHFSQVSPEDWDQDIPDIGIGLRVARIPEATDLYEYTQRIKMAKIGFASQFERSVQSAAKKFARYPNYLRLLLVQFFGEGNIEEEDILQIVRSTKLTGVIDQVWLAKPDWVSADDYEIVWERIH